MNARAELQKLIKQAGGLRTLRLGDQMYVYTRDQEAKVLEQVRRKAIRTGHGIYFSDGSREWYEWEAVWNPVTGGICETEGYFWHQDGKRVRCNLVRHELRKQAHSSQVIRTGWVDYLDL